MEVCETRLVCVHACARAYVRDVRMPLRAVAVAVRDRYTRVYKRGKAWTDLPVYTRVQVWEGLD